MKCPFCNAEGELIRKEEDKKVVYRCPECNAPVEVYHEEFEEEFKNIFSTYETDNYQPNPPDWVEGE